MPTDYFLFACLEYEKTKQLDRKQPIAEDRHPKLFEAEQAHKKAHRGDRKRPSRSQNKDTTEASSDDSQQEALSPLESLGFAGSDFAARLEELVTWHSQSNEDLSTDAKIRFGDLHIQIPTVVALVRDIDALYLLTHEENLPFDDDSNKESSKTHANSEDAPQGPRETTEAKPQQTAEQKDSSDEQKAPSARHEDLETIKKTLVKHFPHMGSAIVRYLDWYRAPEALRNPSPRTRPPVGRYAPSPFAKSAAAKGGSDRSGSDRGERGPRSEANNRSPDHEGKAAGTDRMGRQQRFGASKLGRGNSNGAAPRGPRKHERDGRGGGASSRQPQHTEADAMRDAKKGIERLQKDASVDEVTLSPTNSFFRRAQHKLIGDKGFFSYSVGEASQRAVRISRHEPS